MKRSPMPPRKSRMPRSAKHIGPNRARKAREWERVYGSKERCDFVASRRCSSCLVVPDGPNHENAHVITGGTGRKADYKFIIPLCHECHRLQHNAGWSALGLLKSLTFRFHSARIVERDWQNSLAASAPEEQTG